MFAYYLVTHHWGLGSQSKQCRTGGDGSCFWPSLLFEVSHVRAELLISLIWWYFLLFLEFIINMESRLSLFSDCFGKLNRLKKCHTVASLSWRRVQMPQAAHCPQHGKPQQCVFLSWCVLSSFNHPNTGYCKKKKCPQFIFSMWWWWWWMWYFMDCLYN